MAFSLDQFYRLNRRALIWVILFGLLWILRDFFGLIFLTFLLTFFANVLVRRIQLHVPLARRPLVILVYLVFLGAFATFVSFAVPGINNEANMFMSQLGQMEKTLLGVKGSLVKDYPSLNTLINGYIRNDLSEETLVQLGVPEQDQRLVALRRSLDAQTAALGDARPEQVLAQPGDYTTSVTLAAASYQQVSHELGAVRAEQDEALLRAFLAKQAQTVGQKIVYMGKILGGITTTLMVAIVFSFLISYDIGRLGREIQSLRSSKLSDFYEEAAQPVVRFAYVLGRALQAQAMIACVNTLLTVIGMLVLGIPSVALLALLVFLFSFIPVLGVFISTIFIVLVALNTGGLTLGMIVIGMVVGIHAVEAYVLNPLIYGHHMQLNPVLVLIILFVGHHLFPLWGMLLGVPVTYYFLHDVFGVPIFSEHVLQPTPSAPTTAKHGNY